LRWPWVAVGAVLAFVLVAVLTTDLYRFFQRQGGFLFAIGSAGLHLLYLLYSSLVFVLVAGQTVPGRLYARRCRGQSRE